MEGIHNSEPRGEFVTATNPADFRGVKKAPREGTEKTSASHSHKRVGGGGGRKERALSDKGEIEVPPKKRRVMTKRAGPKAPVPEDAPALVPLEDIMAEELSGLINRPQPTPEPASAPEPLPAAETIQPASRSKVIYRGNGLESLAGINGGAKPAESPVVETASVKDPDKEAVRQAKREQNRKRGDEVRRKKREVTALKQEELKDDETVVSKPPVPVREPVPDLLPTKPVQKTREEPAERYVEPNRSYLSRFFDKSKLEAMEVLDLQDATLTIRRAFKVLRPDVVFALAAKPNAQNELKKFLRERDPGMRVKSFNSRQELVSGQWNLGIDVGEYLDLGKSIGVPNIGSLEVGYRSLMEKKKATSDASEIESLSEEIDKKLKEIHTAVEKAAFGIFIKSKHELAPDVIAATLALPNPLLELQKKLAEAAPDFHLKRRSAELRKLVAESKPDVKAQGYEKQIAEQEALLSVEGKSLEELVDIASVAVRICMKAEADGELSEAIRAEFRTRKEKIYEQIAQRDAALATEPASKPIPLTAEQQARLAEIFSPQFSAKNKFSGEQMVTDQEREDTEAIDQLRLDIREILLESLREGEKYTEAEVMQLLDTEYMRKGIILEAQARFEEFKADQKQ